MEFFRVFLDFGYGFCTPFFGDRTGFYGVATLYAFFWVCPVFLESAFFWVFSGFFGGFHGFFWIPLAPVGSCVAYGLLGSKLTPKQFLTLYSLITFKTDLQLINPKHFHPKP